MPLRPRPRVALPPATRATPRDRRASVRAALAVLPAALAAALAACGDDPFGQDAQFETQASTVIVYPAGQAPAELPVALDIGNLIPVRPALRATTGGPNFDVALDLDAAGQVRVLLPQFVLLPVTGVPRVGVQAVAGTAFDEVTMAPQRNYRYDTVTVAAVGQTVIVQTPGVSCSQGSPNAAKFVVDSVVGPARAMYVRMRLNPNCGFRSLAPGVPQD